MLRTGPGSAAGLRRAEVEAGTRPLPPKHLPGAAFQPAPCPQIDRVQPPISAAAIQSLALWRPARV